MEDNKEKIFDLTEEEVLELREILAYEEAVQTTIDDLLKRKATIMDKKRTWWNTLFNNRDADPNVKAHFDINRAAVYEGYINEGLAK